MEQSFALAGGKVGIGIIGIDLSLDLKPTTETKVITTVYKGCLNMHGLIVVPSNSNSSSNTKTSTNNSSNTNNNVKPAKSKLTQQEVESIKKFLGF